MGKPNVQAGATTSPPFRARRWLKRVACLALVGVVVVLVAGGLVFTPVAGVVIRPKLEQELGVETSGGSLRFNFGGDVVIHNVTFSVPEAPDGSGPKGQAARFLTVKRGQVLLWWRAKLGGQQLVRRVEIFDADVVLSKPLDDFDLNILAIQPPTPDPSTKPAPLPSIIVHRASILLGEHNAQGQVLPLRTLPMVASLRSSRDEPGSYEVTAFEDPGLSTSIKPLRFEGRLSPDGFSGELGAIDMDDFPPETIPRQLREVYEELRISGRTRGASVRYDEALDVLELVLDVQQGSTSPAPFEDDTNIDARVNLRVPVPTDEDGTLRPLIPASGSGLVRLVQRPLPGLGRSVPWESIQAPTEPGEPGIGQRSVMVEAVLHSTIEDARVMLDVRLWLGGNEPLYEFEVATVEPYRINPQTPWLARPAPVLEKLSSLVELLGSEGTVSLMASVSQVAHDGGVQQRVEGNGALRDGALRFRYFPYPVSDVNGSIEIDDGQIRLVGLRGKTASGAPVLGSATVFLDQIATGVDVDVRAFGVPYDAALRATLDDVAPQIREIALNEEAYARLVTSDLIRPPAASGSAPIFTLGGEADAHIRVSRTSGVMGSTRVDVDVHSTSFGLLPEAFSIPVVATDVSLNISLPPDIETTDKGLPRLLRISAERAEMTSLAGGNGYVTLVATVPIDQTTAADRSTTVDLLVEADAVPIHPQMLEAVPGASGDNETSKTLADGTRGLLRDLGPSGEIDVQVSVIRDAKGDLDWFAQIEPQNADLGPHAIEAREPFRVRDVVGAIRVDGRSVHGEISGGARRGGQIHATFRSDFASGDTIASITTEDLNLEAPVEDAVAVFSPELAEQLSESRNVFDVEGTADVATNVQISDGEVSAEITAGRIDRLRFDWLDGRMGIDDGRGGVIVTTTDTGPLINFDRLVAEGTFNGEGFGRVRMRGDIPLNALRERGSTHPSPTRVDLEIQGGSLDSALLKALASNRAGEGFGALLEAWQVRGEYDALVAVETAGHAGVGPGMKPLRSFELSPYDASIVRHAERFMVPWLSGVISGQQMSPSEAGPGGAAAYRGEIDHLTLGGDGWWLGLDGYWRTDGAGRSEMETTLDGVFNAPDDRSERRHGIPTPIFGFVPEAVIRSLDALMLESKGGLMIEDGALRLVSQRRRPLHVQFESTIGFDEATLGRRPVDDQAVQDSDAPASPATSMRDGMLTLTSDSEHPSRLASIALSAADGEVWGLSVRNTSVTAEVTRNRAVELEGLRASVGGGRIAGRGRITLPEEPGSGVAYQLDLSGAGLETERLVAAVQDRSIDDQRSAGDLDLSMGLAGVFGDAQSLRGRGSMRIREGSPVDLPVAIRAAVEAMNINFGADQYDAMNADFYILGETVTFTRLAVSSPSVVLSGLGTVDLHDGGLDFDVTSRSTSDTSLRGFLRLIREVIVGVQLRGTLDAPSPAPRPQAIVGPLDRLRRMLQGGMTFEEWQKERLRRYEQEKAESASGW